MSLRGFDLGDGTMDDEAKSWRNKYEDAVQTWNEKNREYANTIQQLRLNLSKISVAGNGVDSQLDRQLAALRREIRIGSENSSIQAHVDGITDALRRFDDVKVHQQSFFAKIINNLIQPLTEIQLPKDIERQFKQLQHKLAHEVSSEPTVIVNEFSTVFHALIKHINIKGPNFAPVSTDSKTASKAEQPKRGLWNRIVNKEAAPTSLDVHISNTLQDMISHLRLPKELDTDVEAVKALLSNELTIKELESIIEQITALVIKAFNLEQDKLRNFLEVMTTRLGDMHSYLTDSHSEVEVALQDSATLDQSVKSDIAMIQDGMKNNLEIDELTTLLSDRLDNISNTITEHHQKESQHRWIKSLSLKSS
jgi:diguanylate cyclase